MAFNSQLLDGMVIFAEVVNSGSFTLAAQSSGHSTSYISKEINKLEARLGVRLLHRTTRSLRLTNEGELYFKHCQQVINDAEYMENALSGHQQQPKGVLRISSIDSTNIDVFHNLWANFLERYPLIDLEVDFSNRKVDLINDGFDLLIRGTPSLEDSSFVFRKLYNSESVTVASPAYLEKYGTPTHPSELVDKKHKLISYSNLKQPNLWSYTDQKGKEIQLHVKSRVLTNSSPMEVLLCKQGQGILRVPKFYLGSEIESGELVELFADYGKMKIGIFLIYPSRKYIASTARAFIDFAVAEMEQYRS